MKVTNEQAVGRDVARNFRQLNEELTTAAARITALEAQTPRVRASLTGPFAVAAATTTDVNWNAEILDTHSIHSTSVNTSRLTVPTGLGGVWFYSYTIQFGSAGAAGDRQSWVTVSGAGTRYASNLITTQTAAQNGWLVGSGFVVLADGDYLQTKVYTAQALNINGAGLDYFEMCRFGPS